MHLTKVGKLANNHPLDITHPPDLTARLAPVLTRSVFLFCEPFPSHFTSRRATKKVGLKCHLEGCYFNFLLNESLILFSWWYSWEKWYDPSRRCKPKGEALTSIIPFSSGGQRKSPLLQFWNLKGWKHAGRYSIALCAKWWMDHRQRPHLQIECYSACQQLTFHCHVGDFRWWHDY